MVKKDIEYIMISAFSATSFQLITNSLCSVQFQKKIKKKKTFKKTFMMHFRKTSDYPDFSQFNAC